MAAWAVAWAGGKPIASLVDGGLAGWIGVRPTGALLALPALLPALVLVLLPVMERPMGRLDSSSPGWQTRKEPLRHNAEDRRRLRRRGRMKPVNLLLR